MEAGSRFDTDRRHCSARRQTRTAPAQRFTGSARGPPPHRRAVQGHLSASHHIGLVCLDWRIFRILWDHCVGALAFPYRLSSRRRAIIDLWTDHQQRGTLRYNRRNLSHRCYWTQAVAHTQPWRVLRSTDFLCLPAATDGSRDTCSRHDRVLFSQPLTHTTYTAEIYPTHLRALGG